MTEPTIVDEQAAAVARAVEKYNCRTLLKLNAGRVRHFIQRVRELGFSNSPDSGVTVGVPVVVVLINVDDPHGRPIAEALMPDTDWQPFRDRGETPVARGIAMRAGILQALSLFDSEAAAKLGAMSELAIVVIDRGVAEVFATDEVP